MSRLTLKLWGSMVVLILIMLGFLWMVQTMFLQPYYDSLVFNEITTKLNGLYKSANNIVELDASIQSNIAKNYPNMYEYTLSEADLTDMRTFNRISRESGSMQFASLLIGYAQNAFNGDNFQDFIPFSNTPDKALLIATFVPFANADPCVVVIFQIFKSVTSIQNVLKNQLTILSLVLFIASFFLSLILARIFTKPILAINKTVDRIAEGDLEASANVTQKDELGELSHSVDNLAKSLKKVDILRKELIANVSHELKSPLSLIRGYAELVREISWKNDKDRNDNLNLIIDESQRMSVMVNDILDYSLIQSGYLALKTEVLPLDVIINDAALEANKQGEKFLLSIEVNDKTPNVNVCVDNIKIHQVFRNLLNNAINHSQDGEKIKINSFFKNGDIRIEICNKGDPIPVEERSLIWERYHRAQHQGGRKQGTGLGLSIVKTICDAHNMVYGTDYIDENNVFWFQIPMNRIIIDKKL